MISDSADNKKIRYIILFILYSVFTSFLPISAHGHVNILDILFFFIFLIAYMKTKESTDIFKKLKFNNINVIFKNKILISALFYYLFFIIKNLIINKSNFTFSFDILICAPFEEEFLYRLLPVAFLDEIFEYDLPKAFITALLFSFNHDYSIYGKSIIFLLGILFYYSYKKTDSIYAPMLFHFIDNLTVSF